MTRSQRIKKIVKLSENKERTAAREFAAAQKILKEFKDRLSQLKGFRQEYMSLLQPGTGKHSIKSLREKQAFILQIDEGIKQLNEQIRMHEAMNNKEREKWLHEKRQLDTMENIFDRFRKTEQQMIVLREQYQMDDLSQRQIKS